LSHPHPPSQPQTLGLPAPRPGALLPRRWAWRARRAPRPDRSSAGRRLAAAVGLICPLAATTCLHAQLNSVRAGRFHPFLSATRSRFVRPVCRSRFSPTLPHCFVCSRTTVNRRRAGARRRMLYGMFAAEPEGIVPWTDQAGLAAMQWPLIRAMDLAARTAVQ